jgi:hypothetical protein
MEVRRCHPQNIPSLAIVSSFGAAAHGAASWAIDIAFKPEFPF